MSIAALRARPDLTVGALLTVLQAVVIVAGFALFVELLLRSTRNIAVTLSVALAAGFSPMFAHTLAPPWEAAAFAVCASCAFVGWDPRHSSIRSAVLRVAGRIGLLFVAALVVPAWMPGAATGAALAVALAWPQSSVARRWLIGSAVAAVFMATALMILSVSRPDALNGSKSWRALASCAVPQPSVHLAEAARTIGWLVGPVGLALALLGMFLGIERIGWRRSLAVAGSATIGLALLAGAARGAPAVLAPWIVALWSFAASGMQEIVLSAGRRSAGRLASAVLIVLLPGLQMTRVAAEERDDWIRPLGHERATLRQVTALVNMASPDGTFVEEDSTVDVLLRASLAGRRRTSRRVIVVARQPVAIRRAMATGVVYAFPRGQDDLSHRGFVLKPVAMTVFGRDGLPERIAGVAAITGVRPCRVIGDRWIDLPDAASSGRLALAADSEGAYGPVEIYLGGEETAQPRPDGWPPRTNRGFRFGVFDQRATGRSDRLLDEARDVGLTDHPVLSAPSVVRLLLHRTPRAPMTLAVVLGAPFPLGVAKLEAGAVNAGVLTVCDAPAIPIPPFGSRVE